MEGQRDLASRLITRITGQKNLVKLYFLTLNPKPETLTLTLHLLGTLVKSQLLLKDNRMCEGFVTECRHTGLRGWGPKP